MIYYSEDCNILMKQVYETGFVLVDLVLYLDTHPEDKEALDYYYYIADLYEQAVKAYEEQCGPLTTEGVMDENYWTWVNDPWPWEGVCG